MFAAEAASLAVQVDMECARPHNQRLTHELQQAHMSLQAQSMQPKDMQPRRDEGQHAKQLEVFVANLQRELEVAAERTQLLEHQVATMHSELRAKPGTSLGAPAEPVAARYELVSVEACPSVAIPKPDPEPPARGIDASASMVAGVAAADIGHSDGCFETGGQAMDAVTASEGEPNDCPAGNVVMHAATSGDAAGIAAGPISDEYVAEPALEDNGAAPAASEDLWEFVVQGRMCPPGEADAARKGVTCFPQSAMSRLVEHRIAFVCARGRRMDTSAPNQDDVLLAMCRCQGDGRVSLYGVFDGHGPAGHQCAAFARGFLPERIFGDPSLLGSPESVLRAAFAEAQAGLVQREGRAPASDKNASGTTATVALILELPRALGAAATLADNAGGDGGATSAPSAAGVAGGSCEANSAEDEGLGTWIFVAHIGDSRAVIGSLAPGSSDAASGDQPLIEALALTKEHRPEQPEEAEAVRSRGGEVRSLSGRSASRIFVPGRPQPGLALSRVLGDTADSEFGVSSEPEISSHRVRRGQDRLLLLGTDGFFEFCPSREAVTGLLQKGVNTAVLEALCNDARQRWARNSYNQTCDDATAIAVALSPQPSR